ncbi:MAG: hypothetical protein OXG72_06280 [Acidobacteria bacterium]|nr:hypothetical protein [Acidobacteriota bacterium]
MRRSKWQFRRWQLSNELPKSLSAHDDLIENNQRRIRVLERAARMLYKEWFVRLRFPGGLSNVG